ERSLTTSTFQTSRATEKLPESGPFSSGCKGSRARALKTLATGAKGLLSWAAHGLKKRLFHVRRIAGSIKSIMYLIVFLVLLLWCVVVDWVQFFLVKFMKIEPRLAQWFGIVLATVGYALAWIRFGAAAVRLMREVGLCSSSSSSTLMTNSSSPSLVIVDAAIVLTFDIEAAARALVKCIFVGSLSFSILVTIIVQSALSYPFTLLIVLSGYWGLKHCS
ncbi:MAG: hypothetical protein ACPH5V_10370, partial [Alcanivorax sp.]